MMYEKKQSIEMFRSEKTFLDLLKEQIINQYESNWKEMYLKNEVSLTSNNKFSAS